MTRSVTSAATAEELELAFCFSACVLYVECFTGLDVPELSRMDLLDVVFFSRTEHEIMFYRGGLKSD